MSATRALLVLFALVYSSVGTLEARGKEKGTPKHLRYTDLRCLQFCQSSSIVTAHADSKTLGDLSLHINGNPRVLSSWGRVAGPWSGKAQQLGTPLSNDEYRQFFRSLRAAHRASTACHLRTLYGCQNPLVRRLDEYENHGIIPEGPICSELTETSFFPNFCAFAFYRCTTKRYFIKRTACPGEHKANLGSTQTFNNMALSSDAALSATFSPQPIFLTSPATTQPSSSSPNMEGAGISSSSPDGMLQLGNMQPSASHPAEVTVSSQQQGQLPATDIEDLLLRLQDSHVQSLVHTMKQLLAMGKAVMEEELQAAALKLLVALNNASVSRGANSTDTQHGRKT